jgi:hypothetical protein
MYHPHRSLLNRIPAAPDSGILREAVEVARERKWIARAPSLLAEIETAISPGRP